MSDIELGARRFNQLEDDIVREMARIVDDVTRYLLADGYPYGFEIASEREEYENLVKMMLTNDPAYWEDPSAVQRLDQLRQRYGAPPEPQLGSLLSI